MEASDVSDGAGGWLDMLATFQSRNLPPPPVPESLRLELKTFDHWHWGTHYVSPESMYHFGPRLARRLLASDLPHHVGLSYSGHGINSYAITYFLVYRGLVVVTQVGWGGVYMDEELQRAALADVFRGCTSLIDSVDELERDPGSGRRLVVIESELRLESACGWASVNRPEPDPSRRFEHYPVEPVEAGTAMAAAERILRDVPGT